MNYYKIIFHILKQIIILFLGKIENNINFICNFWKKKMLHFNHK